MRSVGAYLGVAAMLYALLSAPMFHAHDSGEGGHADRGHSTRVVHAHIDGHHHSARPDGGQPAWEEQADRVRSVRWIDAFVFSGASPSVDLAFEAQTRSTIILAETRKAVPAEELPRVHGPPSPGSSSPRPPPTS